jgi:putative transposase
MIQIQRQAYQSDLKKQEWKIIEPHLPAKSSVGSRGRPQEWPIQEILNAIFYVLKAGGAWRMMPHDLPPWQTVYYHYRKWSKDGTWEQLNAALREQVREAKGREKPPSAAIIDSQSVKTTAVAGVRGHDVGKKVTGRKRHALVDTLGLLLLVIVTTADVQDRDGAKLLLTDLHRHDFAARLQLIWADGGYRGQLIEWVKTNVRIVLEIITRDKGVKGFQLLPRRWVVERTFAWLNHFRRLSKDYEEIPENSEAFIYLAMIHLMVRRLGRRSS